MAFAALSYTSYSQSLGYEDLSTMFSRNDRNGSARFVAMGGAFGAVGGDVTAMTINPAGISIFNDSNASIAFQSRSTDYLTTYYGNSTTTQQTLKKGSCRLEIAVLVYYVRGPIPATKETRGARRSLQRTTQFEFQAIKISGTC